MVSRVAVDSPAQLAGVKACDFVCTPGSAHHRSPYATNGNIDSIRRFYADPCASGYRVLETLRPVVHDKQEALSLNSSLHSVRRHRTIPFLLNVVAIGCHLRSNSTRRSNSTATTADSAITESPWTEPPRVNSELQQRLNVGSTFRRTPSDDVVFTQSVDRFTCLRDAMMSLFADSVSRPKLVELRDFLANCNQRQITCPATLNQFIRRHDFELVPATARLKGDGRPVAHALLQETNGLFIVIMNLTSPRFPGEKACHALAWNGHSICDRHSTVSITDPSDCSIENAAATVMKVYQRSHIESGYISHVYQLRHNKKRGNRHGNSSKRRKRKQRRLLACCAGVSDGRVGDFGVGAARRPKEGSDRPKEGPDGGVGVTGGNPSSPPGATGRHGSEPSPPTMTPGCVNEVVPGASPGDSRSVVAASRGPRVSPAKLHRSGRSVQQCTDGATGGSSLRSAQASVPSGSRSRSGQATVGFCPSAKI